MPHPKPLGVQLADELPPRDPVRTFTEPKLRSVRRDPHSGHGTAASVEYADMDIRCSNRRSQSLH